ncbi:TPA: hypothetical protein EYO12_00035 [Candidatus Saccharibacteria bacterium]|nr:hypothetical protein [Candidatus Saccharibacteria bacterium]HIO87185.1 hypothetical protein [Candidatus Saccharibacteria bacterium]
MADLQEALAARERRSRFTAIAISVVIILIVGFIVFRIANNGDSEQDVASSGQEQTEQIESESGDNTETAVDLDELFGSQESDANSDEPVAEVEDEPAESATDTTEVASNATSTTSTGDLPNTGPAENAALAVVVLGAAYAVYTQNKTKLAEARLK